jgi:lipoate-protein ligase A
MVSHGSRHAALVKKSVKDASCFSSPSWYEIVVRGRKIAGSAQRRLSAAFLQHGSILIAYDPALETEVIPGGGGGSGVTCINQELGCDVPLEKVNEAFHAGFAEALRMEFT